MEPKEEIQHLCQTLEHHNYLYYVPVSYTHLKFQFLTVLRQQPQNKLFIMDIS